MLLPVLNIFFGEMSIEIPCPFKKMGYLSFLLLIVELFIYSGYKSNYKFCQFASNLFPFYELPFHFLWLHFSTKVLIFIGQFCCFPFVACALSKKSRLSENH